MSKKENSPAVFNPLDIEEHYDRAEQLTKMALSLELSIFESGINYKEFNPAMSLFTSLMLDHTKALEKLFMVAEKAVEGGDVA